MAHPQCLTHCQLCLLFKSPRFLAVKFTAGTVKTHNRRKNTILRPTGCHFIIFVTQHMSANIMAPPAISNIGSCIGKIRLKIERLPGNHCIPGKSNRISVTSRTCISGKRHRTFSISFAVKKMKMIENPERI